MTTDAYPPIYGLENQKAYTAGWRARLAGLGIGLGGVPLKDPAVLHPDGSPYFRRGWTEADAAIRLGRNIGQCGQLPRV